MLSAVIIDDEVNNSNYLEGLIREHLPEIELKGCASSVNDGIALIAKENPVIVFLDIELHTGTGFDLLARISPIKFSVIFTTAHERYALKAIKFAALDFLLKPIDINELKQAVVKAGRLQSPNQFEKNLGVLLDNMSRRDQNKKIAISSSSGIHVLEILQIVYCGSDGPYTTIFTKTEKILSTRHLKEYENLLTEYNFCRVHKSFLVNLNEIKHFSRSDGGYVIMSNGHKVDVSDKRKQELMDKLSSNVVFLR